MIKSSIIFLMALSAICLMAAIPAYCQDDSDMKTIDGRVVSVDPQNSKIVIETFEDMDFTVASGAKMINSDGFDIRLKDISAGNYVMVDYYTNSAGKNIIKGINVEYKR